MSCDTSSSSSETAWSGLSAFATSVTASTKLWTWSAMSAANSSSPSLPSPVISSASDIQQPPSFECPTEGDLVGVLQVPAHRQSTREPGDPQAHRLDQAGE